MDTYRLTNRPRYGYYAGEAIGCPMPLAGTTQASLACISTVIADFGLAGLIQGCQSTSAPELRAHVLRIAERLGAPTPVREDGSDKLAITPPPISPDGKWHEIHASHRTSAATARTTESAPMARAGNSDV